jgi:hypothetical protein
MSLEPQQLLFLVVGIAITAFILGRKSRNEDVKYANHRTDSRFKQYSEAADKLRQAETHMQEFRRLLAECQKRFSERQRIVDETMVSKGLLTECERKLSECERKLSGLHRFVDETLVDWKKQGVLLPSLIEWSDRMQKEYDDLVERDLIVRKRPGLKAAEEVKLARAKARKFKKEAERLRPQLALYESLAPWLAEYTDLTVEEILKGVEEEEELKEFYKTDADPVSLFVTAKDWNGLTEVERNQLALDRYWQGSRRRTAWTAGIQYERFIGYLYESDGYRVVYHGAKYGLDDLGIDLVCTKGKEVKIVQCKRLSPVKGIPVRENVIAQIYGAAKFYAMENYENNEATPVLYSSYQCSETASKFAKHLGVELNENIAFKPYPSIKCNISQLTGERIYHLPFDQQYDSTIIGDVGGEFYAATVDEAEEAGFRRAYRWMGDH